MTASMRAAAVAPIEESAPRSEVGAPVAFKRVVVGVDGTSGGRDAILLAEKLRHPDGQLTLAHVILVQAPTCHDLQSTPRWREVRKMLQHERETIDVTAEVTGTFASSVSAGLRQLAEDHDADLIVVGSTHHGAGGRLLRGDDTRSSLGRAACAVAVAPHAYAERPRQIETIGVGYDGSIESKAALAAAHSLAARHPTPRPLTAVGPEAAGTTVRGGTAAGPAPAAPTVRPLTVVRPPRSVRWSPAAELVAFADAVDLLVVGSRGHGRLRRSILGSTSMQLARRARSPLLVIPRRVAEDMVRSAEATRAMRSRARSPRMRRVTDTDSIDRFGSGEQTAPGVPASGSRVLRSRARRRSRPRIDYLATGGTIASVQGDRASGAAPTLTAETIAQSVTAIAHVADLRTAQFMQQPSTAITFADVLRLRDEIERRIADGSCGVVITQGTDTIEETAFALELLWDGDAPIVLTGAMRNASLPGADGPANLLAAVQVAASSAARGLGVLVVFNDEVHGARFVSKTHTSSPSAFQSRLTGPLGWVSEGRPTIATRPIGRFHLSVPSGAEVPPVALIRVALGDDGSMLPGLQTQGFRGVVIEGSGGGHVTPAMMPRIEELAARIPVVLASRTGAGELLRDTYRYCGSEIELLAIGAISAGALDGLKARVLLSLCLAVDQAGENVAAAFEAVGLTPGSR